MTLRRDLPCSNRDFKIKVTDNSLVVITLLRAKTYLNSLRAKYNRGIWELVKREPVREEES